MGKKRRSRSEKLADFLSNLVLRSLLLIALAIPYRWRVPLVGWLSSHLIAPLAGYNKRIRKNLKTIFPDMAADETARITRNVADNMGRTLAEIYSGREFVRRVQNIEIRGDGAQALEQAHQDQRPVILVTGHFGNYDVPRAALIARGYRVGALYRPMQNRYFNQHYEQAIGRIGSPVFARGRRGYGEMLRFVRAGGMTGFLIDQHMSNGAILTFFDQPAATALSAAQLALKYDALLVPIYGIRLANGLDFEIRAQAAIPHSTATEMTQALNDDLESLVRQYMDQWFWVHRRWKPERIAAQRRRAAKKNQTGPTG